MCHADVYLFAALVRLAELRVRGVEFSSQGFSNTAWAFVMTGMPVPSVLDPLAVFDICKIQLTDLQLLDYFTSMHCLAVTGNIAAGFKLLERAEDSGMLSSSLENCYQLFRLLLEACRASGKSDEASQVRETVGRLGFAAVAPVAKVVARD
eukprot:gnl/TRDRNA2_/TRDRNA2_73136_c0_seq1.p1 gnl/TRDRNA2_/TRDRNA2_73136_c0~~gnl/TRDRNA2_/TRDRNA2_73136_c0_seq1.p1  ORF type:complete len:151 (-),score=13.90 gnl/TRDRNA2_/TRDRNA2_73136_c0_seq1:103-555(-)